MTGAHACVELDIICDVLVQILQHRVNEAAAQHKIQVLHQDFLAIDTSEAQYSNVCGCTHNCNDCGYDYDANTYNI